MRKNNYSVLILHVLLPTLLSWHVTGLDDGIQNSLLGVFSFQNNEPTERKVREIRVTVDEPPEEERDGDDGPDDPDRLRVAFVREEIEEVDDDEDDEDDDDEGVEENATINHNDGIRSEFFGTFRKLGVSWGHMVRSYIRIIGLAGGKEQKGDIFADTIQEALPLLRDMTRDIDFGRTPHNIHGHGVDDLLLVFLRWAETNGAEEDVERCPRRGGVNGRHDKINVSMALRRLEMYVQWVREVEGDLMDEPITDESVANARDAFSLRLSHDDCHRLVWWFDLGATDVKAVQSLPPRETRRFFVWFAHLMMFDAGAQDNGLVFVSNNLDRVGFLSFMTMLPLQVGIKLDEFCICVVPLSTKLVTFVNTPSWAHFAYRILRTFLKRDMKRRVWFIDPRQQQTSLEDALGQHDYADLVDETLSRWERRLAV